MDERIPTRRTPINPTDLYATLRAAWRLLLAAEPSRASLMVLLAQWSLEDDRGRACNNWNIAGIKWTRGCGHDFASYPTIEHEHGLPVLHSKPDDPATFFRAYATLEEGVVDYLRTLLSRNFLIAWPAVEAGDVAAFAHLLHVAHYYTDPEAKYAAGMAERRRELEREIGADTVPDLAATAAAVAAVTAREAGAAIAQASNEHPVTGTDDDPQPSPPGTFTPPEAA